MAAIGERAGIDRRAIALIAAPTLACIFSAALVFALRPEPIRTHRDAIAYVLRQRGIPYESIAAAQPWPLAFNYYAYGSEIYPYSLDVTVTRRDAPPLLGNLECRDDQRSCFLTLRDAGVIRVATPDPRTEEVHPWLEWLERIVWP